MSRPAEPSDWKTLPMPEQHARLLFDRIVDTKQMEKLRQGFVPSEQEDKWFVVFSDGALSFYRAWTGFCIYRVRFEPHAVERFAAVEVIVNRQADQYRNTDDAADVRTLQSLIDSLLR
jgi:hypothetical protein